jgi:hypothetical protein
MVEKLTFRSRIGMSFSVRRPKSRARTPSSSLTAKEVDPGAFLEADFSDSRPLEAVAALFPESKFAELLLKFKASRARTRGAAGELCKLNEHQSY